MKNIAITLLAVVMLAGCETDATVASRNISVKAEQFEIFRRIVFYNSITDTYILSVEGFCSVETDDLKFRVTCKVDDSEDGYLRHELGRSDNTFPFVEQLRIANVSTSRYKVIFKPSVIIPDVDLK